MQGLRRMAILDRRPHPVIRQAIASLIGVSVRRWPFVVSLSNHERPLPFDMLTANGLPNVCSFETDHCRA